MSSGPRYVAAVLGVVTLTFAACGRDTQRACADTSTGTTRITDITTDGPSCAKAQLLASYFISAGAVTATEESGRRWRRMADPQGEGRRVLVKSNRSTFRFSY